MCVILAIFVAAKLKALRHIPAAGGARAQMLPRIQDLSQGESHDEFSDVFFIFKTRFSVSSVVVAAKFQKYFLRWF